jgi:exo-beta-1,3-glucanase (GH17 family)
MTYTPYTTDGGCKDAAGVLTDITAIKAKGFTTIRIYGTDCGGLASVGDACKANGMKMILGVFIKADGIAAARPQIGEIVTWGNAGHWDMVVMIVVGNEAIHSKACDASSLASFISEAKGAFTAAGQGSIPVTTTETVDVLGANKAALCPVIDVTAANIQSFFDGKVVAANAGDFVASQLEMVKNFCPGKPYYNLESGWPSGGGDNGASVASPDAQKAAMGDIVAKAGDKTVVFSFQDDAWKAPGIEQHFGCSKWF